MALYIHLPSDMMLCNPYKDPSKTIHQEAIELDIFPNKQHCP